MSAIPAFRIWRPSPASKPADAVRSLLTPAFPSTRVPVAHFSSSPIQCKGKGKGDNNPNRGVSPVRRTGLRPRQTLSVRNPGDTNEVPVPRKRTSQIQGDPNHGLYEFFRNKRLMVPPSQEAEHGRAWSVNELRGRDWETLQQLWWVCVKERNRLATEMLEMKRLNADYQMPMVEERDEQVQKTMKAIIDTLVERNIAYKDALKIAHQDPTVEFSRTGIRYQEQTYEADEVYNELDDPAGAVPNEVRENQPAAVDAVFEESQRPRDTKSQ